MRRRRKIWYERGLHINLISSPSFLSFMIDNDSWPSIFTIIFSVHYHHHHSFILDSGSWFLWSELTMPVIQQIKMYPSRVWKSVALYSSLVTLGLSLGVAGPTMLDLGILVQDSDNIAYILPGRAGGYAIGSFLGLTFFLCWSFNYSIEMNHFGFEEMEFPYFKDEEPTLTVWHILSTSIWLKLFLLSTLKNIFRAYSLLSALFSMENDIYSIPVPAYLLISIFGTFLIEWT